MMGAQSRRGFTIIEVVLFLAISGLLAVLLMTGWTVRVNTERYRDSVTTLQSFLQQQYNLVYNVENDRTNNLTCNNAGRVVTGVSAKGQTNCVLLGRFITIGVVGGETQLNVSAVVGLDATPTASDATKPLKELLVSLYGANVVTQDVGLSETELTVPWGATIVGGQSVTASILRDPRTGAVHTYSIDTNGSLNSLLANSNNEAERHICLDPGAPFSGERIAVVIRASASSQNAIETEVGC